MAIHQEPVSLLIIGRQNGGALSVTMVLCWKVKILTSLYEKIRNTFIQMTLFGLAQNAELQQESDYYIAEDPTTQEVGRVGE